MSELSTEGGGGGGNLWARKYGPLPLWGWAGIVLLLALFYSLWKKDKSGSSSSSSSNTTGSNGTDSSSVDSPGGVDASLVPQFVNQVYNQQTPPAAPNVTVNNTTTAPTTSASASGTGKVNQYPAPSGLSVSNITRTAITASWSNISSPSPAPSSYTVAVYNKAGKVVSQTTVNAPDTVGGKSTTTITGLPNGQGPFQIHVWANGGSKAPPHASSTFSLA